MESICKKQLSMKLENTSVPMKRIICIKESGLKQSTSFVVTVIPEVTFNGQWLCDKIASHIENLGNAGFCVCGLVAGNHSSNVNAFTSLKGLLNQSYYLSIQITMASEDKRTS